MPESNFVDYVKIYCRSGKGGRGSMHLRHVKYNPNGGPDGGDGGLGRDLREACSTLGRDVVVDTPSGRVCGMAVDLRPGLVLRDAVGGPAGDGAEEFVVSAGDVASARFGA